MVKLTEIKEMIEGGKNALLLQNLQGVNYVELLGVLGGLNSRELILFMTETYEIPEILKKIFFVVLSSKIQGAIAYPELTALYITAIFKNNDTPDFLVQMEDKDLQLVLPYIKGNNLISLKDCNHTCYKRCGSACDNYCSCSDQSKICRFCNLIGLELVRRKASKQIVSSFYNERYESHGLAPATGKLLSDLLA